MRTANAYFPEPEFTEPKRYAAAPVKRARATMPPTRTPIFDAADSWEVDQVMRLLPVTPKGNRLRLQWEHTKQLVGRRLGVDTFTIVANDNLLRYVLELLDYEDSPEHSVEDYARAIGAASVWFHIGDALYVVVP